MSYEDCRKSSGYQRLGEKRKAKEVEYRGFLGSKNYYSV